MRKKKKNTKFFLKTSFLEIKKESHIETSTEGKPWLQNLFQSLFKIIPAIVEIIRNSGYFPHNFVVRELYGFYSM